MDLKRNSLGIGERPALLLVDMINGFTNPECPLGTHCPEVIQANQQLLNAFRARCLPIFFTTVVYRDTAQARVFRERIPHLEWLQAESPWVEVDAHLAMQAGEILIEKQWPSAFFRTDLAAHIASEGVDSIVVTGLTTSGCVRASVVDALQHDLRVVVAEEAVGDRNPDAHRANLFDMHAKYADVEKLASVLQAVAALPMANCRETSPN
ncbi:isochorismatase family protein [Microbulbifer bruguierae]|uniref:Isochorismatase family protein n=1 Tax=Microbulbifer bruguierae TaxID=3029061 RepID=A0ABY8ND25_9GAMM|nr:isochorismatase family protein [Microbulbifer bruguierae]WGL16831.1 isochorismatase family protein [Microbulbifer bruguierae]